MRLARTTSTDQMTETTWLWGWTVNQSPLGEAEGQDIHKCLRFSSSGSNLGLLVGINQFISGHEEMQVITDSRAGVGENASRN